MRAILLSLCCLSSIQFFAQKQIILEDIKAFPTAEGYGKNTTGGNTGTIYHVINLNNSGAGSFRDAIKNHTEPRSIVFDVSGYINITTPIKVRKDYGFVTVLGQTSPKGVCLRGAGFFVHDEEIIIRHIKVAPGRDGYNPDVANRGTANYEPPDALSIKAFSNQYINNVVIDHCTIKWGHDGLLDTGSSSAVYLTNVSVSNSLFYENIDKQYGMLFDSNGTSGNISFFNNILWNNKERNIYSDMRNGNLEIINNIFNYYRAATGLFFETKTDLIGNMWNQIPGAPNEITGTIRIQSGNGATKANTEVYVLDNTDNGSASTTGNTVNNSIVSHLQAERIGTSGLVPHSNSQNLAKVVPNAGTKFKDTSDNRIISLVNQGTGAGGIITHENQVGGFPVLSTEERPSNFDSLIDGISNDFVNEHSLSGNGTGVTINWDFGTYQVINDAGYTDREIYWAWLANDFENLEGTEIPSSFLVDQTPQEITSYSSQDNGGAFEVSDDGGTLKLTGSSWKKAPLDYTITAKTVLEFEFRVDGTGEIHAVGFDDNTSLNTGGSSDELFFKLFGTQVIPWGNTDFEDYSEGEGWKRYSIPVGEYITGAKEYIVFVGDKDSNPSSQDSSFRNVNFIEEDTPDRNEITLEAECSTVGAGWRTITDGEASGGQYLLPPSGNTSSPPSNANSIVTFGFEADAGSYGAYARVRTPTLNDDSFWVRANGGRWIKWNNIPRSTSFNWHRVYDSDDRGTQISFDLVDGTNTVDIAHREDGAGLDKIFVTALGNVPTGMGETASNCNGPDTTSSAVTDILSSDATASSLKAKILNGNTTEDLFRLYPNPTTNMVNINGIRGEKDITVLDFSGKVLYRENSSLSEPNLDLSGYAPGTYYIRILGKDVDKTFKVIKK